MLCLGLKASECVDLNIQDINLEQSYVYIKRRTYPKVNISSSLAILTSEYLNERLTTITEYGHEDAFFLSLRKQRISLRSVQELLQKYVAAFFGDNASLTSTDLCLSFRDSVFNNTKNPFKTAELSGCSSNTVYSIYQADLTQRLSEDTDIFEYN